MKEITLVNKPEIKFLNKDGIRPFKTKMGHQIRLFIEEKGDTRQHYNVDPVLIPILKIIEYPNSHDKLLESGW